MNAETGLLRELTEIIPDPNPTDKSHYYCITSSGKKSIYDQIIYRSLKPYDKIPVIFTPERQFAIPFV